MRDLTDPRWMKLKALLLLVIGVTTAVLLWLEAPSWRVALLIALLIWSFCRVYYFAFYVIERYVDPQFRFSGLWSALRYLLLARKGKRPSLTARGVNRLRTHHESPLPDCRGLLRRSHRARCHGDE